MTTPPQRSARRAVVPLLRLVLAVQAAQILVAVISGIAASTQHFPLEGIGAGPVESGPNRLLEFAGAGDGLGALLMLLATVLLWLVAMLPRRERSWGGDYAATSWLLILTGLSAALTAAGYLWAAAGADFFPAGQEVRFVGSSVIYAAAMAGAVFVLRGVNAAVLERAIVDDEDDGEAGAAVFAVDRKTGAVLAWPSRADAREKAPLYGVEDDEYEWFLDDGVVLQATSHGRDVSFAPTGEERPDDLLRHLKDYASRRGIVVDDEDADEPLAYVEPIARDHYLEMWPGWLRWLGRLTR